jgi:DNA repair protein RecO (recombination protein O)
MLHTTRGIVLHTLNYTDTSIIARVYTERFGLQAYMINGARGKKSKIRANIFQPLALVDMVVYHKEKSSLQRISEIRNSHPFITIPFNMVKTSIVMFLNEVLYKSIREEEPNERLFGFLYHSVQILDLETDNCSNFHLCFLVQLSKYMGFFPQGKAEEQTSYFDLQEGTFTLKEPLHPYYLDPSLSLALSQLTECDYGSASSVALSNAERRELLSKLILYYELHLSSLREINSHRILEDVIS